MSSIETASERATRVAKFPLPGIVLAHFIVSGDVERSRRFYTDVLGGETVHDGGVTYVALANSWIIINSVAARPTTSRRSRSRPRRTRIG